MTTIIERKEVKTINLTKESDKDYKGKYNKLSFNYLPYYTYHSSDLSHDELMKDQRKHFEMLRDLKDMKEVHYGCITLGMYERLIKEKYSFNMKVLNDKPYNMKGFTLVELYLNYCSSSPVALYIDNSVLYMFEGVSISLSLYKPYN